MRRLGEAFPDLVFWNTGGIEVNALDKEVIDLMAEFELSPSHLGHRGW